ncbi:MAG: hypothetical protein ACYS8X_08290 [Planctomycetota bacterium]|jgi:hypothetical protein
MKLAVIGMAVLAAALAGCNQPPMTRYEVGDIRLDVGGRVENVLAVEVDTLAATTRYSPDIPARQVMIEARLVSADLRDQRILGIKWWPGVGDPFAPTAVENTSPRPVPVTVGFGFGVGGGHGRHVDDYHRRHHSDGGWGTGVGFGFPLEIGGDGLTSVRLTFEIPPVMTIDGSYLLVLVQTRRMAEEIIAQPMLLPLTVSPADGDEPPPQEPTTYVTVQDDQTIVLSGLTESVEETTSKVPVLGDIPALGRLFRSAGENVQRSDLLVFITPKIILHEE